MKEDYCSFETIKLLKECGFPQDGALVWAYSNDGKIVNRYKVADYITLATPTIAIAMKWLRTHGFHIVPNIYKDYADDADGKVVDEWTYWSFNIYSAICGDVIYEEEYDKYDSCEEAAEGGITAALNLYFKQQISQTDKK